MGRGLLVYLCQHGAVVSLNVNLAGGQLTINFPILAQYRARPYIFMLMRQMDNGTSYARLPSIFLRAGTP